MPAFRPSARLSQRIFTALTIGLTGGADAYAQCAVADVNDPSVAAWSAKIVGALAGAEACYPVNQPDAFKNADCNIFAGLVLERVYGVKGFRQKGDQGPFLRASEIGVLIGTGVIPGWSDLGPLTGDGARAALDSAHAIANRNRPVVAVFVNDANKTGHIVLVGPGPLRDTGSLGNAPVSASFFQGSPKSNYIGKPLSCGFNAAQRKTARLFGMR